MSNNDFDVNFDISNPPADASERELNSREMSKMADRAHKAEMRCTELSERLAELRDRLGEHMVRASSLSAMREEVSHAWTRIGTLESQCGNLTRKNESLEETIIDLRRDLRNARGEAMTLRDAHGYKCFFSWETAPPVDWEPAPKPDVGG